MAGETANETVPNEAPGSPAEQAAALSAWNEVAAEREAENANQETADLKVPGTPVGEPAAETAAPAAQAAETTDPDPFAGLSPAVVERLKRLDAVEAQLQLIPQLQRSLGEAQGRVGAMQREMELAKQAAKAASTAPNATQIAAAAKTPEKWAALKADFPEWADATEEFVKASLASLTPQQAVGLSPAEVETRIEQRLRAAAQQAEFDKVSDRYENWQETVKTPDFTQWFQAQTDDIKRLAASPRGRDAIQMLDLFARAKAAPASEVQQTRQNKLAAAVTTRATGAAKPAAKSPDQMSPAELWEHERKTRAAKANGLVY